MCPLNNFGFLLQGASASYPSHYCSIHQDTLKKHGTKEKEHNHLTVTCQLRDFGRMKQHIMDQISDVDTVENLSDPDDFFDYVNKNDRTDIERQFRLKGKYNSSIIANNNSGIDNMEFSLGGELHNEIGQCNDWLKHLYSDLKSEKLDSACCEIKQYLDSPKRLGGAGCTPGQHHGGQYNGRQQKYLFLKPILKILIFAGKDAIKIFSNHANIIARIPESFTKKKDYKVLLSTLHHIFSVTRLARFLTASEISTLEENVINLSKILFLKFKHKTITIKMHDILGNPSIDLVKIFNLVDRKIT